MVLSICLIFIDCYGKKMTILFKQDIHTTVNKAVFKINWTRFLSYLHIHVLIIASQQTFVLKGAWHTLVGGGQEKLLAYCYLSLSSHIKCRLLVFSDIKKIPR
jgi:hypothetical protein